MAEDKDQRKIVYYKGREYYIIEELNASQLLRLEDKSKPNITRLVEKGTVITPEEFEYQKENRMSTHQNNICNPGGSKR